MAALPCPLRPALSMRYQISFSLVFARTRTRSPLIFRVMFLKRTYVICNEKNILEYNLFINLINIYFF